MRSRSIRFVSTAILAAGMMTLMSSCPVLLVGGSLLVSFSDPALESIIIDKLGLRLTPVTKPDMLALKSLDISGMGIHSLDGLEWALNLEFLDASNNQFSDLRPLRNLINLKTLDVKNTEVEEVSHLENLTSLSWLSLCGDPVVNLQALIDNTGFGTGDTLLFPCDLVMGPGIDAQLIALFNKGVFIVCCEEDENNPDPSQPAVLELTGLTSESPNEVDFGNVSQASPILVLPLSIRNTGNGVLVWNITSQTSFPTWLVIAPEEGITATETDVVFVSINPSDGTLTQGVEASFDITLTSNGGDPVEITIKFTPVA